MPRRRLCAPVDGEHRSTRPPHVGLAFSMQFLHSALVGLSPVGGTAALFPPLAGNRSSGAARHKAHPGFNGTGVSRPAFPELNKQRLGASPTFLQTWNFPRPVNAPLVCFILLLSCALFREEGKKKHNNNQDQKKTPPCRHQKMPWNVSAGQVTAENNI